MKRIIIYAFCLANLYACSEQNSTNQNDNIPTNLETKVDKLVKEYIDLGIFSGVVLIAKEGRPLYHKAFGLANQETNVPNTLNTRFDIGSMNKSMTKVLILKLVQEGKMKLDDKLGQFLNGFPKEAADMISIDHLLSHQSGYGDYHTPEFWDIPLEEKSLAVSVDFIKNRPLLFEPGEEQEYSNAGYVLLGVIAEKVTGESYYDLIEQYVTKPLKMKNTFLRDKYSVPNRAVGYFKNFKGELRDNEDFQEIPTPAGGFYSTTTDMLTFYRAFHYGDQLWDESTRGMDGMYNFYQENQNTGGAMTHAGGFEGANTVHYEILRNKISVIVFANMDEPVAENLGAGILAIIRGKKPESPNLPANQLVYTTWKEKGPNYVKKNWEALTVNFHPEDPKDIILNAIGYDLFFNNEIKDAVEIFKLNTELFPDIANCWDSYGEGLLAQGKKEEALKAYKKALSIRPDLTSSVEKVKELSNAQNITKNLIPFQYIKNQILIEVKLNNNSKKMYMLFDTGVDPSVIDLKTAEKLNLKVEKDNEGEASGRGNESAKIYPTIFEELLIQNEKHSNIEALAFDMSGLEKKLGAKVHGILGYSFIKDKIFRIDYKNKIIQFFTSSEELNKHLSSESIRLKFYTDGEDMIPLVDDIRINNNRFLASFDTGSSLNIQIYEHRLEDLKLDSIDLSKLDRSQLFGAQGKKKTVITTLDSVVVGNDIVFNKQEITISSIKNTEQLRMGNIGNKFLEHFRVTFDYLNKEIILEPKN